MTDARPATQNPSFPARRAVDRLTGGAVQRDRLLGVGVVAVLTVIFALVNRHWLSVNVVTYGWDRLDHLITSLVYNDLFTRPQLRTLYDALSYSNYYPPLVHYTVVVLYKLFGVSEDVAAMVNGLYLLILLAATWSIARRMGVEIALLATVLLGLFPMIFAMSRYLYLDFALTAMVAACVATLLATERLQRRRQTLLFGASVGLAFLVKWTTAAFLLGPLAYIVWRSGILPYLLRHPAAVRPNWRRLGLAGAGASALNALWLLPARDAVAAHPFGWWLLPLFGLLLGAALYALFAARRDGQGAAQALNNALSGGAIGLWILSLWYLTNSEFVQGFLHTAYGLEDGRFWAYGKYLSEVIFEQLGLFYAAIFALVAVVWLVAHRRTLRRSFAALDDTAWVLLLWVLPAYVIFSTRVSLAHSRFVMPLMPPFAVWIAAGVLAWRPRALRRGAVALLLAVGVAQFAAISFEALAPWRSALTFTVAGRTIDPVAHGFFIQYPASGVTDKGYVVAPEVLDVVDRARQTAQRPVIDLGLLVNSYQLHEKQFLYEIYVHFPQVRLRELARNWRPQAAYSQLFEMDFVLVGDTHSFRTNEASQAVVERILNEPGDLFNLAFRPVQQWTFPSGETLTLYTRRFAPTEPGLAVDEFTRLFGELLAGLLGPDDALILTAPDQAYMAGLVTAADHPYALVPLPATDAEAAETTETLAQLARDHRRLFLVQHNTDQADPDAVIAGWLHSNLMPGSDIWTNSVRTTPFVAGTWTQLGALTTSTSWRNGLLLTSATWSTSGPAPSLTGGGALLTRLNWSTNNAPAAKASLQLLDPSGNLIAQHDEPVADGEQESLLLMPRTLAPGLYSLTVIAYAPDSGARFPRSDGAVQTVIATLVVE